MKLPPILGKMFWNTLEAQSATESSVAALLDSRWPNVSDISLTEVLDRDDVLQECKAQNERLLQYFTDETRLQQLINLMTCEPGEFADEKLRFKYPNLSCELLNCDVPVINSALASNHCLLNKMFQFFSGSATRPVAEATTIGTKSAGDTTATNRDSSDSEAADEVLSADDEGDQSQGAAVMTTPTTPLNPLLASFVVRTFSQLLVRETRQLFAFIQLLGHAGGDDAKATGAGFVDSTLHHIGNTSCVVDLFLRLVSPWPLMPTSPSTILPGTSDPDCIAGEAALASTGVVEHSPQAIATQSDAELRDSICQWLADKQELIEKTIALFDEENSSSAANASQLLCDLIRISREQQLMRLGPDDTLDEVLKHANPYANALLLRIETDEILDSLAEKLFASRNETVVSAIVAVLEASFESIQISWDSSEEMRDKYAAFARHLTQRRVERYIRVLTPKLPRLCALLSSSIVKSEHADLLSQVLDSEEGSPHLRNPVGQARIALLRLANLLLSFESPGIEEAFLKAGFLRCVFDLLFGAPWNSFLQHQVCLLVENACVIRNGKGEQGESSAEISPLFKEAIGPSCRLLERIIDWWDESEANSTADGTANRLVGSRRSCRGIIGELTRHLSAPPQKATVVDEHLRRFRPADDTIAERWGIFSQLQKQRRDRLPEALGGAKPSLDNSIFGGFGSFGSGSISGGSVPSDSTLMAAAIAASASMRRAAGLPSVAADMAEEDENEFEFKDYTDSSHVATDRFVQHGGRPRTSDEESMDSAFVVQDASSSSATIWTTAAEDLATGGAISISVAEPAQFAAAPSLTVGSAWHADEPNIGTDADIGTGDAPVPIEVDKEEVSSVGECLPESIIVADDE